MIKQSIYIIVVLSLALPLRAQWKEVAKEDFKNAILESETQLGKQENYSYHTLYRFFDLPDDPQPKLTYKGGVRCEGKMQFEISLFEQLIVQNEKYNVTLDSVGKHIIVKPADSLLYKGKTELTYADFLKSDCKVYVNKTAESTTYMLEFPPKTKYKSVEISFDKKGMVSRYSLLAGQEIIDDSGPENKTIQPRMDIEYSQYLTGTKPKGAAIKKVSEFIEEKEGKLYLTAAYKTYTLVDLRIKNAE